MDPEATRKADGARKPRVLGNFAASHRTSPAPCIRDDMGYHGISRDVNGTTGAAEASRQLDGALGLTKAVVTGMVLRRRPETGGAAALSDDGAS